MSHPEPGVAFWTQIGLPTIMEESLNDSCTAKEHHTLLGAVLQSIRSVDNGLKEAFDDVLTGFKASSSIEAPNTLELAEINRKLKSSEEDLDLTNKRFNDAQVSVAEVENLKDEMNKARQEAIEQKATIEQ
ncbi:hypothetical protein D1007_08104 [Hordeum vulgare]|nr:hypothetical protein D1007_08104 [Hordeum vulgare]